MTINIYTKTVRQKTKTGHIEKLYGVIEGPIGLNQMLNTLSN